jgi:hypothetical protein
MIRISRIAGALVLVALSLPAAAAAGPGWVTPVGNLTVATGNQFAPSVAVNSQGDTVVVWSDASQNVWESERPLGGSFSVGTQIDSTDVGQGFGSVAIDDTGQIYVFFVIGSGAANTSQPVVATKLLGGSTWTITPLAATNASLPPSAPLVGAVTPSGMGVAVWLKGDTSGAEKSILQFATKASGSSTWSAGANVTNTGNQGDFSHPESSALAVDPSGDAALVFRRVGTTPVWGTTLTAGSSVWTSANKMSSSGTLNGLPVVAIDSSGNATGAWARFNSANYIVQFATKPLSASAWPAAPAGTTSTPGANDLSPLGSDASQPAIAVEPDGTTTVAWTQATTTQQERTRPAGSVSFDSATTLATTLSSPSIPVLTAGADGSVFALWSGQNASAASVITGASRGAGASSFTNLPDLPGDGNSAPAAASDNLGNVSATWINSPSAGQYRNQATGLEAPTISGIAFPATAIEGQSFSYGATVTDRWATATSSVDFGDGTSGPFSGTKAYGPGTFNATFTATDAFSSTSVIKPITVQATGGGGGGTGPTAAPPAGTSVAPVISALALSRSVFAARASGPTVLAAKKPARGTTVSYRDSEVATATFAVQRRTAGVRRGKRCVAPPRVRRKGAHLKACTRFVSRGSFRHQDAAGLNKFRFSGRLKGHALAPGRYRFSVVAVNAAAQKSAVVRISFRIVKPK